MDSGEIGELAIIRICHMTPGLAPGEGHEYEGPAFHDCGMHYVDIARWYAGCDYETWHAQGMRMWNYKDPWWLQCQGTFQNGIVASVSGYFPKWNCFRYYPGLCIWAISQRPDP